MSWGAVRSTVTGMMGLWSMSCGGFDARPSGDGVLDGSGWGSLVSVTAAPVLIVEGGTAEAVVTVSVRDGYVTHVDDVRLTPPADLPLLVGAPVFPPGQQELGDDGSARVRLEGDVDIRIPVSAGAATVGLHTWDLLASVRVCSAHGCRAVREGRVPWLVSVVAREGHDLTRAGP